MIDIEECLRLTDIKELENQVELRCVLRREMVGTTYPMLLNGEIRRIQEYILYLQNQQYDDKVGVVLARMQPLHNAHLFLIKKACAENQKVVVMLGSSNKTDMLRNPFSLQLRTYLLFRAITREEDIDKIKVDEIPDWSKEDDIDSKLIWGRYLYYNIVSRANSKRFSIYFSDDPNIMKSWFEPDIIKNINFRFFERDKLFDGLSTTKIREAFEQNDLEYIKKYCPESVVQEFDVLRAQWLNVKQNPKEDFSMK